MILDAIHSFAIISLIRINPRTPTTQKWNNGSKSGLFAFYLQVVDDISEG